MKISYSNLACPSWSIEYALEKGAEFGFDGFEWRLFEGDVVRTERVDAQTRKEIVKKAKARNIDLVCIGASTEVALSNTEARTQTEHDLRAFLEMASEMEIPFVRTFGGDGGGTESEAVQRASEMLNRVANRAEELGVEVLLETHDYFSASRAVRDVLSMVDSSNINVVWDIHSPHIVGETVDEVFRNLGTRLRHLHIKDAFREADDWRYTFLGNGEIPVKEIVSKLHASGYRNYLTVEWERAWHPDIEPAEVALPQYLETLKKYIEQAGS